MLSVRKRDRRCRFPLCGCSRFGLRLHVSHSRHRGLGGNPAGDRTTAETLVYICAARHRESAMALDRGTIRWRALTPRGANGPIAWDVDILARDPCRAGSTRWIEVARESAPGLLEPLTAEQTRILTQMAEMAF